MRLRRWWRWTRALALVVVGAAMVASGRARADGSSEPPGEHERVVVIGPQAVIIVNEHGQSRMFDDPSQQDRPCPSKVECLGAALGVITGGLLYVTYENSILGEPANASSPIV